MSTENQVVDNESFETALAPEPLKRKRSSILKQPDKRSRDSRTVSFNDKYFYKELYQDGTCDITNFFLGEDMDITMMDIIDPIDCNNQTIDTSVDMSMDQTIVGSQCVDITLVPPNNNNQSAAATTTHHDTTLDERDMISMNPANQTELQTQQLSQHDQQHQISRQEQQISHQEHQLSQQQQKQQQHEISQAQHQMSQTQHQLSQTQHQISQTQHQLSQTHHQVSPTHNQISQHLHQASQNSQLSQDSQNSKFSLFSQISDVSSLDDTLFGAFHDSNNLSSVSYRTSGVDTLVHNIEALHECVSKLDHETDECRRRLDAEIQDLFKFYRHIVNKDDPYEFAVAIFGLRYSLWLIIKINPETYPFEKLKLRFAVNKKDRHLYPFKDYALAVRRYTKEGSYGYLRRFVISAQRFRRFLKKNGYGKSTNSQPITQSEK